MSNTLGRRELQFAKTAAVDAAREVGVVLRRHLHEHKRANLVTQHDIKLELDVRSQALIEKWLAAVLPEAAVLGEEGTKGDVSSALRWVVDPIDGTVNFAYGIPHAAISIALQKDVGKRGKAAYEDGYRTILGVVYDPFADEMWTAMAGQAARLNGKAVHVSNRRKLAEAIVSIGFAKSRESLEATLPYFLKLVHSVRKIRMMGSAALALTYVASGRFDAYIERGIRLWDIAAGGLIVECAGGTFWRQAVSADFTYRMVVSNPWLRRKVHVPV